MINYDNAFKKCIKHSCPAKRTHGWDAHHTFICYAPSFTIDCWMVRRWIAYVQFQNETWPDDSTYAFVVAAAAVDDVRCGYCASGLITGYALNVNDGRERSQDDRTTIASWMDHLKTKVIKEKRPKRSTGNLWRTLYCDWLQLNNAIIKRNGLRICHSFLCVEFIVSNQWDRRHRSATARCSHINLVVFW